MSEFDNDRPVVTSDSLGRDNLDLGQGKSRLINLELGDQNGSRGFLNREKCKKHNQTLNKIFQGRKLFLENFNAPNQP